MQVQADAAPRLDGAPPDLSRPDAAPWPLQGLIYLAEVRDAASGAQQGAAFVFITPSPMPFFSPQKSFANGCHLYPAEEVGDAQVSAGKVSFQGAAYTFDLEPDKPLKKGDWLYPGILFPELFGPQTVITVTAVGDEAPAFQGTVKGVGDLAVSFPSPTVSLATDLTVTFPPSTGTVWVVVSGVASGKSTGGTLRCSLSAASGQAMVPAKALQALPAGATHLQVSAGFASETILKPTASVRIHLICTNLVKRLIPIQ